MKLAIVYTRAQLGISAPLVTVEVHIAPGLPYLAIVGLPEAAVKESKDRVKSAILNSNFTYPTKKIIINLAPADLPKEGGRYDLPIALGILAASKQIPSEILLQYEFAGELALSGELRCIKGALPFAMATKKTKRALIIPHDNAFEASLIGENIVYAAKNLTEVCNHLTGDKIPLYATKDERLLHTTHNLDLADIKGQPHAKRALEIAAAGRHNLLMTGPPGTGKTMLASRLPTILPPLTNDEALEVYSIFSISTQHHAKPKWQERPFRAPHHTASSVAIAGGGSHPKPGEISLAHHGVLFLDELPEFDRRVLEVLREPLESGFITIARANKQAVFPSRFQLIAAMNPCPCGQLSNPNSQCQCTVEQVKRYRAKISSPILERIDMHIEVPLIPTQTLTQMETTNNINSKIIRDRVIAASIKQINRSKKSNAFLTNKEITKTCALTKEAQDRLSIALEKFSLSARSYYKIIRIARTIADLADSSVIDIQHVSEALTFRKMEHYY